jgi:hypothetical protein
MLLILELGLKQFSGFKWAPFDDSSNKKFNPSIPRKVTVP